MKTINNNLETMNLSMNEMNNIAGGTAPTGGGFGGKNFLRLGKFVWNVVCGNGFHW